MIYKNIFILLQIYIYYVILCVEYIVIKGKEKEGENSTDVLLNIIISLNINKEGK